MCLFLHKLTSFVYLFLVAQHLNPLPTFGEFFILRVVAESRACPLLQKQKRSGASFSHSPRKRVQVYYLPWLGQPDALTQVSEAQEITANRNQSSCGDYNTQCPVTIGEAEGIQKLMLGAVRLPKAHPLAGRSKHPSQTHACYLGWEFLCLTYLQCFCQNSQLRLDSLEALATQNMVRRLVGNAESGPYLRNTWPKY